MTWNAGDRQTFSNVAATTADFTLRGGQYAVMANATWGGGSATLQRKSIDNTNYVTVLTAISADGYATVNLPTGTYRIAIATATAVYIEIVSVVVSG